VAGWGVGGVTHRVFILIQTVLRRRIVIRSMMMMMKMMIFLWSRLTRNIRNCQPRIAGKCVYKEFFCEMLENIKLLAIFLQIKGKLFHTEAF
jgi:hypothetical protein